MLKNKNLSKVMKTFHTEKMNYHQKQVDYHKKALKCQKNLDEGRKLSGLNVNKVTSMTIGVGFVKIILNKLAGFGKGDRGLLLKCA